MFVFEVFLSGFGIRIKLASYNELGNVSPSVFGKSWERAGVNYSLNVW